MIKLLKFEFRKLLMRKSTYILIAVQIGILLLNGAVNKLLISSIDEELVSIVFGNLPTSGVKFAFVALDTGGATAILLGIYTALLACDDRTNDTLKNIYSRGHSPTSVFFAELITLAVYGVAYCIVSWLSAFIIGTAFFGVGNGFDGKMCGLYFMQILAVFASISLFFMFSKLFNKTGSVIALNIVAPLALQLVFTLIIAIAALSDVTIGDYSTNGILSIACNMNSKTAYIVIGPIVAFCYCAAFTALGWLFNRRRAA